MVRRDAGTSRDRILMENPDVKKTLSMLIAASFMMAAVPAISVATATGAHAWPKSKKCTDWCTNKRTGGKFRLKWLR
jgi:hypothetical protein